MDTKPGRIIIAGAGASGLMAASVLATHYHVIVLEARDRAGGRIFPVEGKFSVSAEAGAEFIHGDQPLTQRILQNSGTQTRPFAGRMYRKEEGTTYRDSDGFSDQWDKMINALHELQSDMPIAEFLDTHFAGKAYADLRASVKQFAEGYDAADLDRVSSFALREEWAHQDDDDQMRINGGYNQLIGYLLNAVSMHGGEVLLNAPVTNVKWSAGRVEVAVADGRAFHADQLLITVPLGVLQNNGIAFTPALPEHEKAFAGLGFGNVIKFIFELHPLFWNEVVQEKYRDFGFIFSDAEVPTWWSQAPDKVPVITGWLSGPAAQTINKDPEFLFNAAMKSLCYLLDVDRSELDKALVQWHIADWISDPHSLGAYAYATVGSKYLINFLTTPVADTLYFAGEALYVGTAMGTVEAALKSGEAAASKMAAAPDKIA